MKANRRAGTSRNCRGRTRCASLSLRHDAVNTTSKKLTNASSDEPLHLTASIGVATFPSTRVESTEDLFARADEALYRAKSGGRNQVRT